MWLVKSMRRMRSTTITIAGRDPVSSPRISVCPSYGWPAACIASLLSGADTMASISPASANRPASLV